MTDVELVENIQQALGAKALEVTNPDRRRIFVRIAAADLVAAVTALRDGFDCRYLATISGLDKGETFEILYHFASPAANINLRTEILKAAPRFRSKIRVEPDLRAAIAQARALAGPRGTVLIAGSLYLVGEVKKLPPRVFG